MQIVILSGGIATRLKPISETIPKAMMDINGKPFLEYQIEILKKNKIKDIIICVGYLGEKIKKYFRDGSNFGTKIRYSSDGKKLLGTLGAIKKAQKYLNDNFMIIYGDSYLDINYSKVYDSYLKQKKDALMTIFYNKNKYDKSNIIYKNKKIILYDKHNYSPEMQYIDYGLICMSKKVIRNLHKGQFYDLSNLQMKFVNENKMGCFLAKKRFYEIGSFKGIEEFKNYIKKTRKLKQ